MLKGFFSFKPSLFPLFHAFWSCVEAHVPLILCTDNTHSLSAVMKAPSAQESNEANALKMHSLQIGPRTSEPGLAASSSVRPRAVHMVSRDLVVFCLFLFVPCTVEREEWLSV